MRLTVVLSATMLAAASCTTATTTPDEQTVMAADEAFNQASLTQRGQAWKDFADEHASLPAATGKDAIGAYFDKVYAKPGFAVTWHPDTAQIIGDIAVTSGRYESHRQDASGHDQTGHGRYVTVWQRQKEGGWRYVWDGGTEDP